MKVKVSDLQSAALDWAVARALGLRPSLFIFAQTGSLAKEHRYSSDWSQAGPIIEREMIHLSCDNTHDPDNRTWHATITDAGGAEKRGPNGNLIAMLEQPTPLIATMRCYVASKMGEEIEIPDELID